MTQVFAGRFEVVALLGKGGVGFKREGEVTAALTHPGIVRVHSFGTQEQGQRYDATWRLHYHVVGVKPPP